MPGDAPASLDLTRPTHWNDLATQTPQVNTDQPFKRSERQRLQAERQARARQRLVERRIGQRDGVAAGHYARPVAGGGTAVKTAKGCFRKLPEAGLRGERWWRTGCRDGRQAWWEQEVLTFDGDHRPEAMAESVDAVPAPLQKWR